MRYDERLGLDHRPASIPDILAVEQVDDLRFRGGLPNRPSTRTFGGEVAGQAVLAASRTVEGRGIHSAHLHFLLPGDTARPVDFLVERTRDGGSFSARRVQAVQEDRVILVMTASFHCAEAGVEHQVPTPDAVGPSATPTPEEMFVGDPENLTWSRWLAEVLDIDVRFPELPVRAAAAHGLRVPPRQRAWLRARQPVGGTQADRAAALTYLSDVLPCRLHSGRTR